MWAVGESEQRGLTLLSCLVPNGLSCQPARLGFTSNQTAEFLSSHCVLCGGQALPGAATGKRRHIPDFLLTCSRTTAACWRPYFILNHC